MLLFTFCSPCLRPNSFFFPQPCTSRLFTVLRSRKLSCTFNSLHQQHHTESILSKYSPIRRIPVLGRSHTCQLLKCKSSKLPTQSYCNWGKIETMKVFLPDNNGKQNKYLCRPILPKGFYSTPKLACLLRHVKSLVCVPLGGLHLSPLSLLSHLYIPFSIAQQSYWPMSMNVSISFYQKYRIPQSWINGV